MSSGRYWMQLRSLLAIAASSSTVPASRLPRSRLTCAHRDYSVCRGDPDVAAGRFREDVEGPAAVLGRGGQVGAHRGVGLGAGEGAHAPGDLLLDFHHA